jgi:hypothetical protein
MRTKMQLDFVKKIEKSLSPEHQAVQADVLGVLAYKLQAAHTKLEGLSKKGASHTFSAGRIGAKPWRYTITKSSLDETIRVIQEWQGLYDPSWFLIIRITSHAIDTELNHVVPLNSAGSQSAVITSAVKIRDSTRLQPLKSMSVFLSADGLDHARAQTIPFSQASFLPRLKSNRWVVIDSIPSSDVTLDIMTKGVRELAVRLMNVDPSIFGILRCRGVVKVSKTTGCLDAFDVVFDTPTVGTQTPQSLRGHLVSHTIHTLTERVDLAKQIAKAVNYVHTLGFVHKNVRPENLLGFHSQDSGLGSFYLIGFEHFRAVDGRTFRHGDSARSKNIYRHPDRQGMHPTEDYVMQHDIYSLGVCMLEVGMWDSFLAYDGGEDGGSETFSTPAGVLGFTIEDLHGQPPIAMKERLVSLARTHLPSRMGKIYEEVVVNCLTCLDESNLDFGDRSEFEDEDGVLVGVRYIEKVDHSFSCVYKGHLKLTSEQILGRLNSISV